MTRRVLFTHVYSFANKGDAAILAGQIQDLRRHLPQATVDVLTLDFTDVGGAFEGAAVHASLMAPYVRRDSHRLVRMVKALIMMTITMGWSLIRRFTRLRLWLPRAWRLPMSLLDEADAVVAVGGGYLRGSPGLSSTFQLMLLLHQITLARTLRKTVLLSAQSFGPLYGTLQTGMFCRVVRSIGRIYPRERKSADFLRGLGVGVPDSHQVADAAFLFASEPRPAVDDLVTNASAGRPVVGFTVREWLGPDEQATYETAVAALVRHVMDAGYFALIIPQVTSQFHGDDDRLVGARIAARVGASEHFLNLDSDFDVHEIYTVYSSLEFLVGTRFHSVIFALSAGVPAMAIEYEHKTSGILADLGLGSWYLPIEAVRANDLTLMFDALVNSRTQYLTQLHEAMPDYLQTGHVPTAELVRILS